MNKNNALRLREISWNDTMLMCQKIVDQIRTAKLPVTHILAITKGGTIPAGIIHQEFPKASFHTIQVASYTAIGKGQPKVYGTVDTWLNRRTTLIVDEICDSGATFKLLQGIFPLAMYAACYMRDGSTFNPEFWGECAPKGQWLCFPWEPEATEGEIPF